MSKIIVRILVSSKVCPKYQYINVRYNSEYLLEKKNDSICGTQLYIVHVQLHGNNLRLCCFLKWQLHCKTREDNYSVKSAENTNCRDLGWVTVIKMCVRRKLKLEFSIKDTVIELGWKWKVSNWQQYSLIVLCVGGCFKLIHFRSNFIWICFEIFIGIQSNFSLSEKYPKWIVVRTQPLFCF